MASGGEAASANIRGLVRVRPLNEREVRSNPSDDGGVLQINGGTICIAERHPERAYLGQATPGRRKSIAAAQSSRSYAYDAVFGPESTQEDVFESVRCIVGDVCEGRNGTILAYGQTGSGKTHTIFGEVGQADDANAGLFQRLLRAIFGKIAESMYRTTTTASFLEIYNESVYDLLSDDVSGGKGLAVRKHSTKGVYVEGLIETEVGNDVDAMDLLRAGMDNRSVASTEMNRESSRSHAVFVLSIKQEVTTRDGATKVRTSKFTLVDLAGSERQDKTKAEGDRLKEAKMINSSLHSLGNVINALVEKQKGRENIHVPFRDSNLTFLLSDSLGGNSKTCLVATVTPSILSLKETKSTLEFAKKAMSIENAVVRNEDTVGSMAALKAEITRLQAELAKSATAFHDESSALPSADSSLIAALERENARLRAELAKSTAEFDDSACALPTDSTAVSSPIVPKRLSGFKTPTKKDGILSSLGKKSKALSQNGKKREGATFVRKLHVTSIKGKSNRDTMIPQFKQRRFGSAKKRRTLFDLNGAQPTDDLNSHTLDEKRSLKESIASITEERDGLLADNARIENEHKADLAESLEFAQMELSAEKTKSSALQEANAKANEALKELQNMAQQHVSSESDLNAKIAELQASLVNLMDERDSLQQKVENMFNERNTEIDSIIKDVTKLENANVMLQSQLDKKELVIMANEDKIQSGEAAVGELEEEMKATLDCVESTQKELEAEKERTVGLQESVEGIKIELDGANASVVEHQGKAAAEEEMKKMTEHHNESTMALNSKLAELQKNLDVSMSDNEELMKKLKGVSNELETWKSQLKSLEKEKSEEMKKLESSQTKNASDLESFKLQEDALKAEIKKAEETIESLLSEKADAVANLERVTAENSELTGEVEALKEERFALQKRVESLDNLHDRVASLEDEVAFMEVEKEQVDEQLQLAEADLERTIRLHEHFSDTQAAARDDELALCDEAINNLAKEKSKVQEELAKVSQQLAENTAASEENIAILNSLEELQSRADSSLEAELKEAEETAEALRSEKAQAAEKLEKATAHGISLTTELETVKSENEEVKQSLIGKTKELDAILADKESLAAKLKEASDDLAAKQSELETLEHEKSEALKQLELNQAKSTTDLESFQLQEESLRAEVEKANDVIESQKATEQNYFLSTELEKVRSERDASQLASNAKLDELQNGLGIDDMDDDAMHTPKLNEAPNDLDVIKSKLDSQGREKSSADPVSEIGPSQGILQLNPRNDTRRSNPSEAEVNDENRASSKRHAKKQASDGKEKAAANISRTPLGKSSCQNIQSSAQKRPMHKAVEQIEEGARVRVLWDMRDCFGDEQTEWMYATVLGVKNATESVNLRIKYDNGKIMKVPYPNKFLEKRVPSESMNHFDEQLRLGDTVDCYSQDGAFNKCWWRGKVASLNEDGSTCDVIYYEGSYETSIPTDEGKIRHVNRCDPNEWMVGKSALFSHDESGDIVQHGFQSGTVSAILKESCEVAFSDGSTALVGCGDAAKAVFRYIWSKIPDNKCLVWPTAGNELSMVELMKLRKQTRNRRKAMRACNSPKQAPKSVRPKKKQVSKKEVRGKAAVSREQQQNASKPLQASRSGSSRITSTRSGSRKAPEVIDLTWDSD